MGIYNTNSAITAIKHMGSEINAVYHMGVKVWPDVPTEQFTIVHTKQTGFTITVGCSTYNLVTINWGDGTSTVVTNGTAKTHNYAASGTYNVVITGDLTKITSFLCNDQLASSIILTSDCFNITTFRCYSNTLTNLDVSYLERLTIFEITYNATLSNLVMPISVIPIGLCDYKINNTAITSYIHPEGASSCSYFYAQSNPNLENIDVSSLTSCTRFYAYSNPNLVNIDVSSLTSCTYFTVYTTALTSLNVSNLTSCSYFHVYLSANLSNININSLTSCTYFHAYGCPNLIPPSLYFTAIEEIDEKDCTLNQSEVDSVLHNCLSISSIDSRCKLNLHGSNAKPSSQGYLDKSTLVARGWIVNTN